MWLAQVLQSSLPAICNSGGFASVRNRLSLVKLVACEINQHNRYYTRTVITEMSGIQDT